MIDPSEAADEPSPADPASRLGESLKQFTLANEEIGSDVATLHQQLAIETAWIQRHLDVDVETNVKRNEHATIRVIFHDPMAPAEATSLLRGIADPDKTQCSHQGGDLVVMLQYGERYREEVEDAKEVTNSGP